MILHKINMNQGLTIRKSICSFRKLFFLCVVVLSFNAEVYGQTTETAANITAAFNQYKESYVQEKIYAHTDKGSYLSGEICWFRLYYVDAIFLSPASLSKLAYVEILDKNNLPVLQQKVSLKKDESAGSLIIPSDIPSGTYRFRAYTSWMKNFEPEYFFEKPIRIINPRDLSKEQISSKAKRYDIQFFPEGGNLVQKIKSKVAFRMVDDHGRGLEGTGTLINSKGDTILRFSIFHTGIGNFSFTPEEGQHYKAIIRLPDGEELTRDLPSVYTSGYVMGLSGSPHKGLDVHISVSPELEGQEIYLFVHGNHTSLPLKAAQMRNDTALIQISPGDLEDGINQITLFTKNGQPVCERLYFKYPEKRLEITAETDSVYGTRKKIDLNLLVRDQSGKKITADMSLAVYRLDSLQQVDDYDIRNYLYLMAELGPIENPGYFLDLLPSLNDNMDNQDEMENLMLTRGWRRYNWRTGLIQRLAAPVFPPELNGHIIHGRLVGKPGVPVYRVKSFLSVPSARTQFRATTADTAGNVKFELTGFYGSGEVIVQTGPHADSSLHVELISPFSQKYTGFPLPDFAIPDKHSRTLLYQSVRDQVERAYNGPKQNQFKNQSVDSTPFYVTPDESYLLDNYTRFLTMEEVLREYVASLNVARKNDRFELFLINKPRADYFHDEPLILIDGVPFFNTDELFQQDPKKIKRLDLINRQYALGSLTFNGIVNTSTYQGDLDGIQLNAHATVLDYPGIPAEREFFSPAYDTEASVNSRIPDYRTLLYWKPGIKQSEQEMKPIHFYSSDLPGNYAVVVQGITEDGVPGSRVIYFEVRK